jgi:PIN like domain
LPDVEWITALGSEGGWSILSADIRIAKKRPSRELFLRSNLIGFFFAPAMDKIPIEAKAARLLMRWMDLRAIAKSTQRGIFEVPVGGKLQGL